MIRVDFHVHSISSGDSISKGEALFQRAREIGLGKLIITDHNHCETAFALRDKYPDFVIPGEEILTTRGEILAFFVQEEIPKGLEPIEVFQKLREQGAFISLSHPYAALRHGWTEAEMESFLPWLDAIESSNARNPRKLNESAIHFARVHHLPETAGSDAHGVPELGAMGLELPDFHSAEELRTAIRSAQVFGSESPMRVRWYSRKAAFLKKINQTLHIRFY